MARVSASSRSAARRAALTIGLACGLMASPASGQNATLGSITFPNSGSAAAQPFFIEGVKFLHSFEWEDAAAAFQKAEQADPSFALAYWGEALSHTGGHHFPSDQNISAARKALVKLGASRAERLAKAKTDRERGYLNAVELLYGDGDGRERALRYAEAMGALSEQYPEDDEAATLHALALMRTAERGVESTRVDLQAGAIALRVFRKNGNHPARFITSFTPSTSPPAPSSGSRLPTSTRSSRPMRRTRCTCRRTFTSSSACGTSCRPPTNGPTPRPSSERNKNSSDRSRGRRITRCSGCTTPT
jgi:hypothetical protein